MISMHSSETKANNNIIANQLMNKYINTMYAIHLYIKVAKFTLLPVQCHNCETHYVVFLNFLVAQYLEEISSLPRAHKHMHQVDKTPAVEWWLE